MRAERAKRIGWLLFAFTVAATGVMVWLSAGREEAFDTAIYGIFSLIFAAAGALIVSKHPDNGIGWMFLYLGVSNGVWESAEGWGYFAAENGLPGGPLGEWIILWSWIIDLSVFSLVFLYFPDGRLPSRRWRKWLWVIAAGLVLALPGQALNAGLGSEFIGGVNPFGIEAFPADLVLYSGLGLLIAGLAGGLGSLVVRFRRGTYLERQQLKWISLSAALVVIFGIFALFFYYTSILSQIAISLALLSVPIAACVAIIRYRLYDVDIVIKRSLVYATLTAALTGIYLGSVLVLQLALGTFGSDSSLVIAGSTLAVAAGFRPLRARIQGVVDRRFDRRRYDAAVTLESVRTGSATNSTSSHSMRSCAG